MKNNAVLRRAIQHQVEQKTLTEYEQKALEGAPLDWFNPEMYCWYFSAPPYRARGLVRRPYFVAERLYEKGFFERSLVGEYPFINFEFRPLPSHTESSSS